MQTVKLVVIGSGAVGKTCFLIRYTENKFPQEYIPTVFDNYSANIKHKGQVLSLGLWDMPGYHNGAERLRPLTYPATDVFLIMFSVMDRPTFEQLHTCWLREVDHYCPDVPFLLVGTKSDLLNDEALLQQLAERGQFPVMQEDIDAVMEEYEMCAGYLECSALTGDGIKAVIERALDTALQPPVGKSDASSSTSSKTSSTSFLSRFFGKKKKPAARRKPNRKPLPKNRTYTIPSSEELYWGPMAVGTTTVDTNASNSTTTTASSSTRNRRKHDDDDTSTESCSSSSGSMSGTGSMS